MKRQPQSGFAIVELVVALVVLAAAAGGGYYVWYRHGHKASTTTNVTASSHYQSPTTTTPAAPQISNASDLNSALQALNQTSVSSSNTDSSQLSSDASGF